jgi:hypothetical protein
VVEEGEPGKVVVAELLGDREDGDVGAGLLGAVVAGDPLVEDAGVAEVRVVQEEVADAGLVEDAGKIGVPDPFGEPQAPGGGAVRTTRGRGRRGGARPCSTCAGASP